jgi:conjugal transfer pilus assembly protein TraD
VIQVFKELLGLSKMPVPQQASSDLKPVNGVYLGHDNLTGEPIVLGSQELNQHTFLCGTTGSGKTTTILCFVDYALKNDIPLVFVDGKGDPDLAKTLVSMAGRHNRELQVFSISEPESSWSYNPLSCGGPTELKDRLMELSEWREPYYQYMAERYLQMAFTLFEKTYDTFDLSSFIYGLAPEKLELLACRLKAPASALNYLSSIDRKGISGLIDRLTLIIESQIGHLFCNEPGKTISLIDSVASKKAVLFSLDSLAYPLYAKLLGRLVINDLKAVASRRTKDDPLVLTVYDEFNVFARRNVVDLINKTRSKGFAALIAAQSLADLDICDSALKRQIIQNCNTLIIQRQNASEDAEELARNIGTEETWMMTYQVNSNGETGSGSLRFVKELMVHPDKIKRLQVGQAVVTRKIPRFQTHETTIRNVQ